jgi:integrase/recombinase XerD
MLATDSGKINFRNYGSAGLVRGRPLDIDDMIGWERLAGHAEGKSERTIETSCYALTNLKNFRIANGDSTFIADITVADIRGFLLYLRSSPRFANHPYAKKQETPLSPFTVNIIFRALRACWNRWVAEGLVPVSPLIHLKTPAIPTKIIAIFSVDQLGLFFNAIDTTSPEGFRNHTLFSCYLDTAARLGELTSLTMENLDLKNGLLKITGKGNKQRLVPIGRNVRKQLWRYIRVYRPLPLRPLDDFVFLTRDGRKLTNNRVEALMKKYGTRAGITGVRCSPHTLRHTACTMYLRNGGEIFSLQAITGHSSLNTLKRYIHLSGDDISAAHSKFSPVDNLNSAKRK